MATGETFVCDIRKEYKSCVDLFDIEEGHVDEEDENNLNGNVRVWYYLLFPMTVARLDLPGKYFFIGAASGKALVFNTVSRTKMALHYLKLINI